MSVGLASSFRSVPDLWQHRVGSTPESEALRWRVDGRWRSMTWGEAGARVRALTNALLATGLQRRDRCVIFAGTSMEWILADFAILCGGAATTTIYPQASDDEVAYILGDCGAAIAFVDHAETVERLRRLRPRLPGLAKVVAFHAPSSDDGWVEALSTFEARGRDFAAANPEAYSVAARGVGPQDLATLMYTSGTTGQPKGVMLSHDAWVYEAEAIDALGFLSPA
ncbi:MAG: AMP-binding protein, partial [Myxococcales bacterium]|nr:AMP-binding protein [Myxococcales bacterium]